MKALAKLLNEATAQPWRSYQQGDSTRHVVAPLSSSSALDAVAYCPAKLGGREGHDARLIALAVNNLAACVKFLERVAAHFEGTDAPLGLDAAALKAEAADVVRFLG